MGEKKGGLLSYEEARTTLLQCIRLAYLRDCRSWPKFHLAKVDAKGSSVEGPLLIDSDWTYAKGVAGYEEKEISNVLKIFHLVNVSCFPIDFPIGTILCSP